MPAVWPIAKFLFQLVAPNIPDIVSTVATLKNQQAEPQAREEPFQARIADMEQKVAQQLELIESLTKQIDALQTILRRTLIIGLVALGLAADWDWCLSFTPEGFMLAFPSPFLYLPSPLLTKEGNQESMTILCVPFVRGG